MKRKLPFEPCSPICPALTGKPHGSVRYCPMQEPERHKRGMARFPEAGTVRKRKDGTWEQYDWRIDGWMPVEWEDVPDRPGMVRLSPRIPSAPDVTDCCANFQCCAEMLEEAGLAHVAAAITTAVEEGKAVVPIEDPKAKP